MRGSFMAPSTNCHSEKGDRVEMLCMSLEKMKHLSPSWKYRGLENSKMDTSIFIWHLSFLLLLLNREVELTGLGIVDFWHQFL